MRAIKPSFEIITPVSVIEGMLSRIETAGRTCYKSEDKITDASSKDFVSMICKRGHLSVLEHESISVRIICDRGVSHELVRHRIASFSQESTRYCDYSGEMDFIIPPWCDIEEGHYDFESEFRQLSKPEALWLMFAVGSELTYQDLRVKGWKPEQARSILPNSLKTEVVMTANLREWVHIFDLRDAAPAHPQMREIMEPMHKKFAELIPVIFGGKS